MKKDQNSSRRHYLLTNSLLSSLAPVFCLHDKAPFRLAFSTVSIDAPYLRGSSSCQSEHIPRNSLPTGATLSVIFLLGTTHGTPGQKRTERRGRWNLSYERSVFEQYYIFFYKSGRSSSSTPQTTGLGQSTQKFILLFTSFAISPTLVPPYREIPPAQHINESQRPKRE